MDDPEWMNAFKNPIGNLYLLSSSSPSSSPSRIVVERKDNEKEVSDGDSPVVTSFTANQVGKPGRKGTAQRNSSKRKEKSTVKQDNSIANAEQAVLGIDDEEEEEPKAVISRRSRGGKRPLESDEEEEENKPPAKNRKSLPSPRPKAERGKRPLDSDEDEEEYKPPAKTRKSVASPKPKTERRKTPNSGRKGKRVSFSEGEETATLEKVKKEIKLGETLVIEENDEESLPLSSILKKDKDLLPAPDVPNASLDDLNGAASADVVRKEPAGATGLMSLRGDEDAPSIMEEVPLEGEIGEASERKTKPRSTSTLPLVFAEKVHRTKVLLECEGDALDLSGDMGAVGRFSVSPGHEKGEHELCLDLKGILYKTTIVPCNTFFVVNVGSTEAKVETIMSDFIQLHPDANQVEDETIIEGTLEGFGFELDNEGEPLSTPVTGSGPPDSDAEEDGKQKKTPTKATKPKKSATSKGGKGTRAKGNGKGGTAKKPRGKAKGTTSRKPTKAKSVGVRKVNPKKS